MDLIRNQEQRRESSPYLLSKLPKVHSSSSPSRMWDFDNLSQSNVCTGTDSLSAYTGKQTAKSFFVSLYHPFVRTLSCDLPCGQLALSLLGHRTGPIKKKAHLHHQIQTTASVTLIFKSTSKT